MSPAIHSELADLPVRIDVYNGVEVHTFARKGRPCWLLQEIGMALGRRHLDITSLTPVPDDDMEVLTPAEGNALRAHFGHAATGLALVVVYEIGLAIACTTSFDAGSPLRRLLLQDAARAIKRGLRRARLEHRVRETIKQIELEDRTRKAALLHRLVEHARRSGALLRDDEEYVAAMAIVAEAATGLVFPTDAPSDERIATELGEPAESVRGALLSLCEEINA